MKTVLKTTKANKDIVYILMDGPVTIKFVDGYSKMTGTYMGLRLECYDDAFGYLLRNPDLLKTDSRYIDDTLKRLGFQYITTKDVPLPF
jgi:hypothetical protein